MNENYKMYSYMLCSADSLDLLWANAALIHRNAKIHCVNVKNGKVHLIYSAPYTEKMDIVGVEVMIIQLEDNRFFPLAPSGITYNYCDKMEIANQLYLVYIEDKTNPWSNL